MSKSKLKCINLLDQTKDELQNWLNSFDTVLTDCDGTILHDEQVIPGAPAVLNKLKAQGKQIYYITNNGTKTRHDLWQRAQRFGFELKEDEIIAPNYSIVDYLKRHNFKQKVYVIGNPAISNELANFGIESFGTGVDPMNSSLLDYVQNELTKDKCDNVGAVIIGWDEHYSYAKMMKAANVLIVNPKAHFLATNMDTVHKYGDVCIPGTGAFVRPIEICVGRPAVEMGKPNPAVIATLVSEGKLQTERTLMIGDCCKVDVKFGSTCGMQTLLVGTGRYQLNAVQEMLANNAESTYIPDYYVPKLADLLPLI